MTARSLVNFLNDIIFKFQAKNIIFRLYQDSRIEMVITNSDDILHKEYIYRWSSIEDCLVKNISEYGLPLETLFARCTSIIRDIELFQSFYKRFDQNDIRFLKLLGSCSSLEELQIKLDLEISDVNSKI